MKEKNNDNIRFMEGIKLLRFMLGFIFKSDKAGFVWAIIYLLWSIIPTVFNALIYKFLIDSLTQNKELIFIIAIVSLYAFVSIITRIFSSFIYEHRFNRMSLNVKKYSNNIMLKKCTELDMECFDDKEFYDKLSKALDQVDGRAMQVFYQLLRLSISLINFMSGLAIVTMLNAGMIIVALGSGITMYFLDIFFVKVKFKAYEKMIPINRIVDYFHSLLFNKSTISDVKQYNQLGDLIIKKYNKSADEQIGLSMELANEELRFTVKSQSIVTSLSILLPYVYLAIQAYRSIISIADIPAMYNSFNLIVNGFSDTSREITNLKESCLYIKNFMNIIDYIPKIERNEGEKVSTINTIIFSEVYFKYPHSDDYILRDFNISIRRGEKLAIVGLNGAGKSTIVKLLLRYYDPESGRVLINGIDIKKYNIYSLREKIATLLQDFQLYSMPIDEIISCSTEIDQEKLTKVLKKVGLLNKVLSSTKGTHSEYGKLFDNEGIVFSGGEQQKLCIARMCYKDSDIYIMDEPSSALDPISEYEINNQLLDISKDKTVIMIAHRLSTIIKADTIAFIENGHVEEIGCHKDLIDRNGKYANMYYIQSSQYEN